MSKVVNITVKGKSNRFNVSLLNATDALDLLIDLTQLLIDTPEASAKSLTQLIFNLSMSGLDVQGSNDKEVENAAKKLLNRKNLDIGYVIELLLGAVQKLDKSNRNKLIDITLNNCEYINGEVKFKLVRDGSIDVNVNSYINSPVVLINLVKEFLMYNLTDIFSDFFTQTAPNSI